MHYQEPRLPQTASQMNVCHPGTHHSLLFLSYLAVLLTYINWGTAGGDIEYKSTIIMLITSRNLLNQ